MKKILIGFVLVVCAILVCCGGGKGFRKGQTVTVSEKCIWASDEDSYKKMCQLCARKDEAGLESMDFLGDAGILEKGDVGTVTDMDFEKVQIRLVDGRKVWVASKFLK